MNSIEITRNGQTVSVPPLSQEEIVAALFAAADTGLPFSSTKGEVNAYFNGFVHGLTFVGGGYAPYDRMNFNGDLAPDAWTLAWHVVKALTQRNKKRSEALDYGASRVGKEGVSQPGHAWTNGPTDAYLYSYQDVKLTDTSKQILEKMQYHGDPS